MSKTARMFGWLSAAAALASCSKRAQASGSAANAGGQHLDGDVATEPRVARAIDLAHPARAERRGHDVRAHLTAGRRYAMAAAIIGRHIVIRRTVSPASSTLSSRTAIACGKPDAEALGPFHRQHALPYAHLVQAQVVGGRRRQAIQIHVEERQPAAAILVHEGERRAADVLGIGAEAARHAADERGLAGAQRARQQHYVAGAETRRQRAGQRLGGGFRLADRLGHQDEAWRSAGRGYALERGPQVPYQVAGRHRHLPLRLRVGQIAGGAVQEDRELTGRFGIEQLGEPRRQHAGQDVAGAAGGHPRVAGRVDEGTCRSGVAITVRWPFSTT